MKYESAEKIASVYEFALEKRAEDGGHSHLEHAAELGGLGILASPYVHHMAHSLYHRAPGAGGLGTAIREGLSHDHGGVEMAGLGILAAPTVYHVGKSVAGGIKRQLSPSVPPAPAFPHPAPQS